MVKTHVGNVLTKLGAQNRTLAYECGIVASARSTEG